MKDQTLHCITTENFLCVIRNLRAVTIHPSAEAMKNFRMVCRQQGVDPSETLIELMEEFTEMHTPANKFPKSWTTQPRPFVSKRAILPTDAGLS